MDTYNPLLKYVFDTPTNATNYTKDRLKNIDKTYKLDFQFIFHIKDKYTHIVDTQTLKRKDIDKKESEYVLFKGDTTYYYNLYGRLKQIIIDFKSRWNTNTRFEKDFIFFCHELLDVPLRRYLYNNIGWANESNNENVVKRRDAMKEILYPKQMRDKKAEEEEKKQDLDAAKKKKYNAGTKAEVQQANKTWDSWLREWKREKRTYRPIAFFAEEIKAQLIRRIEKSISEMNPTSRGEIYNRLVEKVKLPVPYKQWWDFLTEYRDIKKYDAKRKKIKEMKIKIILWGDEYKWLNDYLIYLTLIAIILVKLHVIIWLML